MYDARSKNEQKIKNGRGQGSGASYKPWIQARELNSSGWYYVKKKDS